jgi:hypothetical protein
MCIQTSWPLHGLADSCEVRKSIHASLCSIVRLLRTVSFSKPALASSPWFNAPNDWIIWMSQWTDQRAERKPCRTVHTKISLASSSRHVSPLKIPPSHLPHLFLAPCKQTDSVRSSFSLSFDVGNTWWLFQKYRIWYCSIRYHHSSVYSTCAPSGRGEDVHCIKDAMFYRAIYDYIIQVLARIRKQSRRAHVHALRLEKEKISKRDT